MMTRFFLLIFISTSCCTFVMGGSETTDTSSSPYARREALGLGEVRWTEGFWAERFQTVRDTSIPAMWEIMRGDQYKPFYQHFLIASGKLEGEHHGAQWNDGDFYKWMEAACSTLASSPNPSLELTLKQCVQAIKDAQRSDGYLHTPVLIRNRNGDATAQPFQDEHDFEMYNMGHLITTACIHSRVTGDPTLRHVAERCADFLDNYFATPTPELARNSVCPSHYMALIELYRTTRNPAHLDLAKRLFAMRDLVTNGDDDNQDRIPFLQQRRAVGHAVRANYLYAGAADLYLESGDPPIRETLNAIWTNVTETKLFLTGGCGALYDGASPDGSRDQSQIRRVHQAYGRNYQLPNTTAHNETCAAIGNVLWNWRMFLASGDGRYMDVLERTLYNGVLCGMSLEGTDYSYVNPLRHESPLPTELRWSRRRVPFVTSFCCPPNVLRTVAQAGSYAFARHSDHLFVNLYGGCELNTHLLDQPLKLSEQTNYPWDGDITLNIRQCTQDEFTIALRIPLWAETFRIWINEERCEGHALDLGYVSIRRQWQAGDTLRMQLDMPAQLLESHPLVEETRHQVAVQRGPIVYCLESADLPSRMRVREIALNPNATLRPVPCDGTLSGLVALEVDAIHLAEGDWESKLYRPLRRSQPRKVKVTLIPYFAWGNRGDTEMSVWLRRAE